MARRGRGADIENVWRGEGAHSSTIGHGISDILRTNFGRARGRGFKSPTGEDALPCRSQPATPGRPERTLAGDDNLLAGKSDDMALALASPSPSMASPQPLCTARADRQDVRTPGRQDASTSAPGLPSIRC